MTGREPRNPREARERQRMCTMKIRYTSKRAARKQARNRSKGQRFRVYACPWCGGHHVTTQVRPDENK